MKVRDVLLLIRRDGWELVRVRGSHRIFKHPSKSGALVVAGHPSVEMPIGTLKSVLRQAKLP